MAIEPNIDPPGLGYIDDLVSSNPDGAVSEVRELDNHVRGIKNVLLRTFAAITGAVTASHTEINKLAGVVAGTVIGGFVVVVDASKNIGTFGVVTATTFVGNLTGNASTATNATVAATATTLANQGALATKDTISSAELDAGLIAAETIAIAGGAVGSFAFLRSVGATKTLGQTEVASNLRYSNVAAEAGATVSAGIWRCLGYAHAGGSADQMTTLWLRIS